MKLFQGLVTAEMCIAALWRSKVDTSLEYLCSVAEKIETGEITQFTLDGLRTLLRVEDSPSIYSLLQPQQQQQVSHMQMFTVKSKEERLQEQLEEGYRLSQEISEGEDFSYGKMQEPESPFLASLMQGSFEEEEEDDADEEEEDEDDEEEEEEYNVNEHLAWKPACDPLPPLQGHSLFYSVFFRINGAHRLFSKTHTAKDRILERRVQQFKEAHVPVVQFLDSLDNVSDKALSEKEEELDHLYRRLGDAQHSFDRNFMTVRTMEHKCKQTPLEILTVEYPDKEWDPEKIAIAIQDGKIDHSRLTHLIDKEWNPLTVKPSVETHQLYYAVVYVMNQCQDCMDKPYREEDRGGPVYDALWAYYVSFMDLFDYCLSRSWDLRMDDLFLCTPIGSTKSRDQGIIVSEKITPWELYGSTIDTRAFHAGDLPDLSHVLYSIPLWGEQQTPSYFLGKLYHKSLPFACQRRHIIKLTVEWIQKSEGFWRIFSKLVWVMLAGLYPGELGSFGTPFMGLRDLLRAKQLAGSKELLLSTFNSSVSSGGGPLVVFTIYSLHILYMASFNDQYILQAKRCIDWNYFKKDVVHLANIIRTNKFFSEDPFARAKILLGKTIKGPSPRVQRLRRFSMAVTLMKQCNERLEKTFLKDEQNHTKDYPILCELIHQAGASASLPLHLQTRLFKETKMGAFIEEYISVRPIPLTLVQQAARVCSSGKSFYAQLLKRDYFKSNILNILVRMPPEERMTLDAFSMLRLKEYGEVTEKCVSILCDLVRIYHERAAPKDFRSRIGSLPAPDFMVVCFYFNMVALLEKIQFVTLDADTVRKTNEAMMHRRNTLFPGENVSPSMFNVSIALCCEKICTLMGTGKHGDKKVAYDIEKEALVCANGKKLTRRVRISKMDDLGGDKEEENEDEDDDEEEEEYYDDNKQEKNNEDDDEEDDDDDDEDDEEPIDYTTVLLEAQNDNELDFNISQLRTNNLIADAAVMKGKGKRRTQAKEDLKEIRNKRKAFSRVPCGQPVLTINLYGRALVWGNMLEKKIQYMFCPQCGALHMYSFLNFSGSETGYYRCNECARKEMMHTVARSCAYCTRSSTGQINENTKLPVLCPVVDPTNPNFDPITMPEGVQEWLYFCKAHYRIASRFTFGNNVIPKEQLWKYIRQVQMQNTMRIARGQYKRVPRAK